MTATKQSAARTKTTLRMHFCLRLSSGKSLMDEASVSSRSILEDFICTNECVVARWELLEQ